MRFQFIVACTACALWSVYASADMLTRPDPSDSTSISASRYDSVFADYRAYDEQRVGAWRKHNDEMGRVGGHAGHAKDAAPNAEPPPVQNMPDHNGHHK
ncbi:MAG TPA: hypothetical protein VJS66_04445 [Burkholderiales bacterium]|nr:hypothetical protein [Burkholderiales bacterium]